MLKKSRENWFTYIIRTGICVTFDLSSLYKIIALVSFQCLEYRYVSNSVSPSSNRKTCHHGKCLAILLRKLGAICASSVYSKMLRIANFCLPCPEASKPSGAGWVDSDNRCFSGKPPSCWLYQYSFGFVGSKNVNPRKFDCLSLCWKIYQTNMDACQSGIFFHVCQWFNVETGIIQLLSYRKDFWTLEDRVLYVW